ncbi:glycogen synthase GlgA [Sphingomonas jeddahensis]|uniref:Glycogen synthase n=1 Tax=Sphingomonas jeddahensis TaxID=1915074 RepID=A0A1V2EYF5_9SPHN|nr:glycogen synthase GlgA [Sphingomonas jeddahensis]ONF97515.1 Glycogen synthase 1 [Sphingomonas jeddahensis]
MKVLSVASEAYPLVKTGGLADVVGALPAALKPHGIEMTTFLPGYPGVVKVADAKPIHQWPNLLGGGEARLMSGNLAGHPLLVLDAPGMFAREGGLYAASTGGDWPDNWRRFAAFAYAAAEIANGAVKGFSFDLLHAHDWQAGLAPPYLRYAAAPVKSVMTVHNIAFQGQFGGDIFPYLDLPPEAWALNGVEYYGGVGYLKAGLEAADAITTVSPTYAREIIRPEFGMGLEGLVATRADSVFGIVNGIDPAVWNPQADPALAARYSADTLARRAENKRVVERAFALDEDDGPLFTVITRLTWQKGMDVLAGALDALVGMGGRLALLGSGDVALEQAFRAAADRHPSRIGVRIGYDEPLSHLLQGGADAIIIPSRFEPCGLTQLYGLAYGCVPIVARTGGLADTIIDANAAALAAGVATGIQFDGATHESLTYALRRATDLYANAARWRCIQQRGMGADFSWRTSGAAYAALYRSLIEA